MLAKIIEVKGNTGLALTKTGSIILLDYTSGVLPHIGTWVLISEEDTFKSRGAIWAKRAYYIQ